MAPFKGKTKAKEMLVEDRQMLKDVNIRELKIYIENERNKINASGSLDADKKKILGNSTTATRKLAPSNVGNNENSEKAKGICDISVKTRTGRKALVDVSNNRGYFLRDRLSNSSKSMTDKSERNNVVQGKTRTRTLYGSSSTSMGQRIMDANVSSREPAEDKTKADDPRTAKEFSTSKIVSYERVDASDAKICTNNTRISDQSRRSLNVSHGKTASKPPLAARKSAASRQIWRRSSSSGGSSTVIAKKAPPKLGSIKTNIKTSGKIVDKPSIPSISRFRTRRKSSAEINGFRNYQLRNQTSNDSKLRFSSATHRSMDVNTLSRKPVITIRRVTETIADARMEKKLKPALCLKKELMPTAVKSYINKKDETANKPTSADLAPVIPREINQENCPSDGNGCLGESVTAIISKPKRGRRRSYTSLLIARSKVLGEAAAICKQDGQPNIDDSTNPLEVAEYVDDIYQYYWIMEAENPSLANYMVVQTDVTSKMRGILINWLIEVHVKFELMQETLFLMVDLLDRFLSMVTIKKDEMQLVGLTALLLASKYEDFWHPKIKELISISSNLYTRDQMLAMEKLILKKLMFRLNAPTPYVFMLRFLKAAQSDQKLEHLAFYLVELCLVEYEALKFKPSLLCASAIYVARCTLQIAPAWTRLLIKHSCYEESLLRDCADMILRFQRAASKGPLRVTYEKYQSSNRGCVAAIKPIENLPL